MLSEILKRKFLHSFSGKLVLSVGTILIVGNAVFWYLLVRDQRANLVAATVESSLRLNDVAYRVLKDHMITAEPQEIQDTIENIGEAWLYRKIRVITCRGRVAFSSSPDEIGTTMPVGGASCTLCHRDGQASAMEVSPESRWALETSGDGRQQLKVVTPILNEPSCSQAACHAHPESRAMLGILEADTSLIGLDKGLRKQAIATVFYLLAFTFALSLFLCTSLWKLVSQPLAEVLKGIGRVARGDLDYVIPVNTRDEMGELASSFNAMTRDLASAKEELIKWADTLEKKVEEKTEAIQRARDQLIQSEKLASLGRMAAGVAHELNSPLTGVVTFGHLLAKRLPDGSQDREDVEVIIEQANRCSSIIRGLLGFARASSEEKTATNLNEVIRSSLRIVENKADFFDVERRLNLDEELPRIKANAPQIQQVFLNMIVNAADAMDGKGTLTITTRQGERGGRPTVEAVFEDTGTGISAEDMEKLFEPFFTTKPVGKGTGLGLAVSHGIIQDHGGGILVASSPGKGATFTVWFPREDDE